jgi:hypothetical protein
MIPGGSSFEVGFPTRRDIGFLDFLLLYLSYSHIWLNPLVADRHFWSNIRKLGKKKKKKKKTKIIVFIFYLPLPRSNNLGKINSYFLQIWLALCNVDQAFFFFFFQFHEVSGLVVALIPKRT